MEPSKVFSPNLLSTIKYYFSTATGYQPAPQAGYAVQPATYTTPRAAATAYDVASYQTAAATQSAYGKKKLNDN